MQSIVICELCRQEYEPSDLLQRLCPVCLFAHALPTAPAGDLAAAEPQFDISPSRFTPPKINELAPHFPQLDIQELAGRGGMSAVYRAHHKHLDRTIALKVLPREIADTHGGTERFQREAQTLAQLNHGNIVDIYDAGQAGPWCFIVMEFVHGPNLRQLMGDNRLGSFDVLRIASDICDGLQYAHDQGVVHRDVKPENVLLGHDGQVKLADFGLAKILDPEMSVAGMTQTRQVMGTPHYLAPEQMETPTDVDNRADVYSLGVMMYEMLTGELPLGHFDPPSERIGSDPALDAIVLRAMSKDPQRRYQQARDIQHGMKTLPKVTSQPNAAALRPGWHRAVNELLLSACSIVAVFVGLLGLAREESSPERLRQSDQQRLTNPSAQFRYVQEVNQANGEVLDRKVPRENAAEPDFGGFAARTAMVLLPFCVSFILARVNVSSAGSWRDLSPLQNLCTPILLTFYLALGLLALLGPGLSFLLGGWLPMWADLETWTFLGQTFGSAEQASLLTPYWLTVYAATALSSALWSILLAFVVSARPQLVGRMFHPIDQRSGAALTRTSAFFAAGILLPCGCILLFAAGQMG